MRWISPTVRVAVAGLLAVIGLAGTLVSVAAEPPPRIAQPAAPASAAVVPIPVPEVAQRAEEVAAVLQNGSERLAPVRERRTAR